MVDYQKVRSIAEAEKLRMRKWVISSLLDSEEAYLEYLNTLLLVLFSFTSAVGLRLEHFFVSVYETLESHDLHVYARHVESRL